MPAPKFQAWSSKLTSTGRTRNQGYKRFVLNQSPEVFRVIADMDEGTLRVWRVDGAAGGEGELLLDKDGVSGEVALALCTWNGASFSVVDEDDSAQHLGLPANTNASSRSPHKPDDNSSGKTKPSARKKDTTGGTPPSLVAGLAGICAVLRQVASDAGLLPLTVASGGPAPGTFATKHARPLTILFAGFLLRCARLS